MLEVQGRVHRIPQLIHARASNESESSGAQKREVVQTQSAQIRGKSSSTKFVRHLPVSTTVEEREKKTDEREAARWKEAKTNIYTELHDSRDYSRHAWRSI